FNQLFITLIDHELERRAESCLQLCRCNQVPGSIIRVCGRREIHHGHRKYRSVAFDGDWYFFSKEHGAGLARHPRWSEGHRVHKNQRCPEFDCATNLIAGQPRPYVNWFYTDWCPVHGSTKFCGVAKPTHRDAQNCSVE